ncbi:hypothetical protein B0H14DRAFT_3516499 [Mycena olivaceomarginata]|nr:hypothetical protein B0H14DRAFT_3516499 [Mycena olivaceomarginata]
MPAFPTTSQLHTISKSGPKLVTRYFPPLPLCHIWDEHCFLQPSAVGTSNIGNEFKPNPKVVGLFSILFPKPPPATPPSRPALPPASHDPLYKSRHYEHRRSPCPLIRAEKADDDGQPPASRVPPARASGAPRTKLIPESVSDEEDEDFDDLPDLEEVSHSSDEGSDSESDFEMIESEEDLLSSKTVPARGGAVSSNPQTRRKSSGTKRKADESAGVPPHKSSRRATVEEVEDEDAPILKGTVDHIRNTDNVTAMWVIGAYSIPADFIKQRMKKTKMLKLAVLPIPMLGMVALD